MPLVSVIDAPELYTCNVISTLKYDHGLSQLQQDELHWLNVTERMQYKLAVTVIQYLQNQAPEHLVNCCVPVSDVTTRQHLLSAS